MSTSLPSWIAGEIYVPYGNSAIRASGANGAFAKMTLLLQVSNSRLPIASELSDVVTALNANIPGPSDIRPMQMVISDSIASPRSTAWLLALLACLALGIGTLGIYGVISYSVQQRTHDIGIRLALGAHPRQIVQLILWQGFRLILVGVTIGLVAAFALTRLMNAMLFGISSADPVTFADVAVALVAVALLGCYIPARRALCVDPVVALRYQ
jgi:putative ABC transport system permease protein